VIPFLRTALALLVVSLYILLIGPPGVLWTALSGRNRLLYHAGHLAIRIGFAIVGIRVRLVGAQHILVGRPAVYVSNHGSNIDPPALFSALSGLFPYLRVLYKAELRRLPVLVWVFDIAGFVPVERANRGQSLPAIDRARQALVEGASFLIFPEGTRSPEGTLLPFKKGGFIMAIGAQVPVVPVVISGGRHAMQKGSLLIRPATITVTVKQPIPTTGLVLDDRDGLIARVRASMEA
jgi:1-acyl-sn-glycerol-3-phosphate acyltransferase